MGNYLFCSSIAVTSGKWYAEFTVTASSNPLYGIAVAGYSGGTVNAYGSGQGVLYYAGDGTKYVSGTNSAYGASYTTSNVIGVALDIDGNTVTFYKNNVSQGAITLPAAIAPWVFQLQATSGTNSATVSCNFGQQPWTYTPPSGFKSLNTFNLP
jgi:hypothetical protein